MRQSIKKLYQGVKRADLSLDDIVLLVENVAADMAEAEHIIVAGVSLIPGEVLGKWTGVRDWLEEL